MNNIFNDYLWNRFLLLIWKTCTFKRDRKHKDVNGRMEYNGIERKYTF